MKDTGVLHHTADSTTGKQYKKTYAYHNAGAPRADGTLKFPVGHGIQYQFFVEKDGEIIEGDIHANLWHAGSWNERAIGICFAGDLRKEGLTNSQINSLVEILDKLQEEVGIQYIYNHNEVRTTSCPIIDVRAIYYKEKRARAKVTPTGLRSQLRGLDRLIRDSVGMVQRSYIRKKIRIQHILEARIFDERDCCAS